MHEVLRSTVTKSLKMGLHVVAFWPGTPFPVTRLVLFMVSTALLLLGQSLYVLSHFHSSQLLKLLDCLSLTVCYNLMLIKLGVIWKYRGVLWEILEWMEEDCIKYATMDTRNAIPKAAAFSERITSTAITYYLVSTTLYAIAILIAPPDDDNRNLVLYVNVPFDVNASPNYELVVAAEFIHLIFIGFAYGLFTALLLVMIVHTGCHVDVLCDIITNISTSKDEEQIRFVAKRHQEIIRFSEQIELIYTYISFAQLATNTISTCCLGYVGLISLKGGTNIPQLVKGGIAYCAVCLEIFTYCFAGEYLTIKSDTIFNAAYQISWYDLRPAASRQVILLLLRSQKGLRLTFGKFSTLSLETFTWIIKASASYMSVFLAMS